VPDYLGIADRSWPVLGPLMRGHAKIYRATRSRIGGRVPRLPSLLLLDHVGRRSAKRRRTPVVYMPDDENLVIVASMGGHPRHPAWFHNLRANPDTEVQIGSRRIKVRAREASGEERPRLRPSAMTTIPTGSATSDAPIARSRW
jgi:F420H(2)-dependent quinone reductase